MTYLYSNIQYKIHLKHTSQLGEVLTIMPVSLTFDRRL